MCIRDRGTIDHGGVVVVLDDVMELLVHQNDHILAIGGVDDEMCIRDRLTTEEAKQLEEAKDSGFVDAEEIDWSKIGHE